MSTSAVGIRPDVASATPWQQTDGKAWTRDADAFDANENVVKVATLVWDPNTLAWVKATQAAAGPGGGGAVTVADGADVTQGAKADAAWDGVAAAPSVVAILKAVWAKLAGTLSVSGTFWQAIQPVSGTFWQATQPVSATTLDVALSTRLKPADTLAGVTTVTTVAAVTAITNPLPAGTNRVGSVRPVDSADADLTSAKAAQTARALGVQNLRDAGRTYVSITLDRAAGIAAEALATMTINKGGTVTTGSSYTVTAGKTLRLVAFYCTVRASTTTIVSTRVRLRSAAAVSATSGILALLEAFSNGAIAEDGQSSSLPIPEGIEIAAAQQIGISHVESTATGTVSVTLIGYEY